MLREASPTGRISLPDTPTGVLELVTGSPINAYRSLDPDDPHWLDFAEVWRLQRDWDQATYLAYWRARLQVWPKRDGPVPLAEMRSWWVWSWRRFGLSDDEIARRLCLPRDTLRRYGAFKRADEHAAPRERQWVRVPLVVAIEVESKPHQFDTWCPPGLGKYQPASFQRASQQMNALTKNGPRGQPAPLG
jgi:hypothetical protein